MQSLVAYKCTSSKNKGDPATLLSTGHKDRAISEQCSWAFSKKGKLKESCNFSHHHKELQCGSLLTYLLGCFITYFWDHRKEKLLSYFQREFTKSLLLSTWGNTLVFGGNARQNKPHCCVGRGCVLKCTSSEMLSGDSSTSQRQHHTMP